QQPGVYRGRRQRPGVLEQPASRGRAGAGRRRLQSALRRRPARGGVRLRGRGAPELPEDQVDLGDPRRAELRGRPGFAVVWGAVDRGNERMPPDADPPDRSGGGNLLEPLGAPWRLSYVAAPKVPAQDDVCFICRGLAEADDRRNLIALRTPRSVVV